MIRNLLAAVVGGTVDYLQGLLAEIDRLTAERDEARAKAAEHWSRAECLAESATRSSVLELPSGFRWAGDPGEPPAGLVRVGQALRRGCATGDLAAAWTDTGIITIVPADEAEAHALVSYAWGVDS